MSVNLSGHLRSTSASLLVLACFLTLIFVSCKKGDTGEPGTDGKDGKDGAANVVYSPWFTADAYVKDTVFGVWGFRYNKAAPDITQAMLDSGTILTFGKLLGYNPIVWPANQVAQLPISLTYVSPSLTTDTWSALCTPGNLRIRFVNDKNVYNSVATNHQFRYIIIPPGKKATLGVRRSGETMVSNSGQVTQFATAKVIKERNQLSYKEICALLDIPE